MTHVDYIKYSSDHKEATLRLLAFLWTHLNEENRKLLFEWRYEQNPLASERYICLAISGDQIVGFRAFVPQILEFKGNELIGLTAADAVVHPDFRRKGIFSGLIRFFMKEMEDDHTNDCVIYNLSSNEYSTPGYLKLGWQATSGLKRFALRYDPLQHIRLLFGNKSGNGAGLHQLKEGTLEISSEVYANEMAELAESYSKSARIRCFRDTRYFNWRYSFRDKTYIFVYLRIEGRLESYLVIHKVSDRQYMLWEYDAKDTATLRKTIKMAVRKIGMPFLRTWVLSEHDSARLRQCGFIAAPSKLWKMLGKKRLPILVRPVTLNVAEKDFFIYNMDVRNIENWQFFLADRH